MSVETLEYTTSTKTGQNILTYVPPARILYCTVGWVDFFLFRPPHRCSRFVGLICLKFILFDLILTSDKEKHF